MKSNRTYVSANFRDETMKLDIHDETGYDAKEDFLIDARIHNFVVAVHKREHPMNPKNILVSAYTISAKLLYLYGLFILFMLAFRRHSFYLWFDLKAAGKITPFHNKLID